jgi:intracellular sulfur oxidation DsrE/DsrF family protein
VIDTTTPSGFAEALAFAGNFLTASASYKLTDHDNAVIIVARHFSTPFAYKDAIWAKYAKAIPPVATMKDPKTGQVPAFNLLNAAGYGMDLPNFGTTVDAVVGRGVQFAVCQMATQFFAGLLAGPTGNKQAVYDELVANLVGNSHLAPAGIVAVNRAQEYGYTVASAG